MQRAHTAGQDLLEVSKAAQAEGAFGPPELSK